SRDGSSARSRRCHAACRRTPNSDRAQAAARPTRRREWPMRHAGAVTSQIDSNRVHMNLRLSEWIEIAYFTYLLSAAVVICWLPRPGRCVIIGSALVLVIAVLTISRVGAGTGWLRDWIPVIYVLVGYWLPALFVTATNQRFERTLLAWDHRWFGIRETP